MPVWVRVLIAVWVIAFVGVHVRVAWLHRGQPTDDDDPFDEVPPL